MFVVFVVFGLLMLLGGAELLVRGGGRIALALRVPLVAVALMNVAFGTSMPEILVSATAVLRHEHEIAIANVLGSNLANIALVLGLAAVAAPVTVGPGVVRREIPILVALHLAVPAMLWDGTLGRVDGALLFSAGIAYIALLVRSALTDWHAERPGGELAPGGDAFTNLALLTLGFALLFVGSRIFVDGAVDLSVALGVDRRVIGLTVVALGTSAPEAVAAVVGAWRGDGDMAVHNSLGSNIFNVAFALGVAVMIQPIAVRDPGTWKDLAVTLLVTLLLVPMILRARVISRAEGALLAIAYAMYVLLLTTT